MSMLCRVVNSRKLNGGAPQTRCYSVSQEKKWLKSANVWGRELCIFKSLTVSSFTCSNIYSQYQQHEIAMPLHFTVTRQDLRVECVWCKMCASTPDENLKLLWESSLMLMSVNIHSETSHAPRWTERPLHKGKDLTQKATLELVCILQISTFV